MEISTAQAELRRSYLRGGPGALTVIETIVPMIGGLLAACLLMPYRLEFVFPVAAIAVGSHYFGFRTASGDWFNWVLGGIMCLVGTASIFYGMPIARHVPYAIAVIEIGFGCLLTWSSVSQERLNTTNGQISDIGR